MSCGGILSSLNLIAAAGILNNTALTPSTALTSATGAFNSNAVTQQFSDVVTSASGKLGIGTLESLRTLGAGTFPAVTNSIPNDFWGQFKTPTYSGGFTGFLNGSASGMMGSGDLSKFSQIFSAGQGYIAQANQYINSAVNSNILSKTFSSALGGMDNVITGSLSQVNQAFGSFGSDLLRTGNLINLKDLSSLGTPSALLSQVASLGGITPGIQSALREAGASNAQISALTSGTLPQFSDSANQFLYRAMSQVTGDELLQVQRILGVSTSGINNMADLLNPQKILPNSWPALTVPTGDGLRGIYTSSGAINSNLESFLNKLPGSQTTTARTTTPGVWDWSTVAQAGQRTFPRSSVTVARNTSGTTTAFTG